MLSDATLLGYRLLVGQAHQYFIHPEGLEWMVSANYEGDTRNLKNKLKPPSTTTAPKMNKKPQQQ